MEDLNSGLYDTDSIHARQLALIVRREVADALRPQLALDAQAKTKCSYCGTEAPADRMPRGQFCHSCCYGVMR